MHHPHPHGRYSRRTPVPSCTLQELRDQTLIPCLLRTNPPLALTEPSLAPATMAEETESDPPQNTQNNRRRGDVLEAYQLQRELEASRPLPAAAAGPLPPQSRARARSEEDETTLPREFSWVTYSNVGTEHLPAAIAAFFAATSCLLRSYTSSHKRSCVDNKSALIPEYRLPNPPPRLH